MSVLARSNGSVTIVGILARNTAMRSIPIPPSHCETPAPFAEDDSAQVSISTPSARHAIIPLAPAQ